MHKMTELSTNAAELGFKLDTSGAGGQPESWTVVVGWFVTPSTPIVIDWTVCCSCLSLSHRQRKLEPLAMQAVSLRVSPSTAVQARCSARWPRCEPTPQPTPPRSRCSRYWPPSPCRQGSTASCYHRWCCRSGCRSLLCLLLIAAVPAAVHAHAGVLQPQAQPTVPGLVV